MMKRIVVIVVLTLAVSFLAFGQTQSKRKPNSGSNVEETLKQMSMDEANAFKNYDTATLQRMLADDWVGIGPDGKRHTKADILAGLKAHKGVITSVTLDSIIVRVYGDTAVVTGNDDEIHTSMDGKDVSGRYAWTDIYVKHKDESWKIVASHTSTISTSH
jgi:ketosteroid isomerase-like protein